MFLCLLDIIIKNVGLYFLYFYYKNEEIFCYFIKVLFCSGLEIEGESGLLLWMV